VKVSTLFLSMDMELTLQPFTSHHQELEREKINKEISIVSK